MAVLAVGLINFEEEQVPPTAANALVGQLVFLSYLLVLACRHAFFDFVMFSLGKVGKMLQEQPLQLRAVISSFAVARRAC